MGDYTRRLMQAIRENPYGHESEMALQNGWITRENLDRLREQKGYTGTIATDHKHPDTASDLRSLRRGVQGEQPQRRGRGWFKPAGYTHFTDTNLPEEYNRGDGARMDLGMVRDNLHSLMRSPFNPFRVRSGVGTMLPFSTQPQTRHQQEQRRRQYERTQRMNYDVRNLGAQANHLADIATWATLRRR